MSFICWKDCVYVCVLLYLIVTLYFLSLLAGLMLFFLISPPSSLLPVTLTDTAGVRLISHGEQRGVSNIRKVGGCLETLAWTLSCRVH